MSGSEHDSFVSAAHGEGGLPMQPPLDDDSGPTPRKRVSQACVPCARRKTKCDGASPTCGQCRQRDIVECVYTTSRRNKRLRRVSPYSFQRPSLGYEDQGMLYPSTESNREHEQVYHQDPNFHHSFAALDALATSAASASSRVIQQTPVPPRPPITQFPRISRATGTRLLKDYFSTIHPMWPILYKPMYDMMGFDGIQESMPPQLLNAIYSIAACVQRKDDDSIELQIPPPSKLYETALMALERPGSTDQAPSPPSNLFKPSIDNCQTLTILALQQHGVAESSSAALLFSLASAMAIELRLHRESPSSDATDVQVRSRLWWNIFVLDKLLACEMKRPVSLRDEETDTPFPSASESDEFQLLSLVTAGQNRLTSVKTHTMSGFHTTIQISMIMEKVSREIYSISGRAGIRGGSDALEDIRMRLWQDLKDYYSMLDQSPLRWDPSSGSVAAPVTITNMVWMWCSTILLHRPFASHRDTLTDKKPKHSLPPLDICFVASNNICDMLERYAENLPKLSCDMIFPIFTTASTLSHYSKQIGREDPLTQKRINMCIRWLQVLGKSWKNGDAREQMLVQDFRPPQEIPRPGSNPNQTSNSPFQIGNENGHQSPMVNSSTPAPPIKENIPGQDIQITGDDWAFLNNFGDATDEFYAMDTNFRELLQGQLDQGPQVVE